MSKHPDYYSALLRRRFHDGESLTETEDRELELHLLICPQCAFECTQLLSAEDPSAAAERLRNMERAMTADRLTPFLHELALTMQWGEPLSDFQRWLWWYLQRNNELLGRFRLFEADAALRR